MQETHLDSRSYPGAILFPGDIWQCLVWGHLECQSWEWGWARLGVEVAPASVGGARDTPATTLQNLGTGPRQRAPRVSNPGKGRGLGQAPSCSFWSPFPFGGLALCHHRYHVITVWFWIPGGDIQGTGSPASRKRKQSCSEEGVMGMSSSVFRVGNTERKEALSLLFGQGTIFA